MRDAKAPRMKPPMPTTTERSSLGYAVAALLNFVFLLCVNAHAVWRPWLGGVVTDAFSLVLWATNLGLVVQICGDLVLSVTSPRPLRRFMEFVFSITGVIGAVVFYRVFPLDLSRFGDFVPMVTRLALFAAVLAASLAVVINFARFMGALRDDEGKTLPPPSAHLHT